MKDPRWFEDVRAALQPYVAGIDRLHFLEANISVGALGIDELSTGFRLGLVSASDAVAIELRRYKKGIALRPEETSIALALPDEQRHVEDLLVSHVADSSTEPTVLRRWHYLVIALARLHWLTTGEPLSELAEIEEQWRPTNLPHDVMSPAGRDGFFFGNGARRRLVLKLGEYLSAERADLESVAD